MITKKHCIAVTESLGARRNLEGLHFTPHPGLLPSREEGKWGSPSSLKEAGEKRNPSPVGEGLG